MKFPALFLLLLLTTACHQTAPEAESATVPATKAAPNPALAATVAAYYTCSMHPQVHEEEPGDCPICGMHLIKVQQQAATTTAHTIRLSAEQIRLGNIRVAAVGGEQSAATATSTPALTGRIVLDQDRLTQVSARVPGRIDRLYVRNAGELVRAGAPLFAVYSEELMKAQQEFLLAQAQQRELKGGGIDYAPLVDAARTKLRLWGMTAAQLQQLTRSGQVLNPVPYFSPAAGVVQAVGVRVGDYVQEGSPVMQLADLQTVWVEAQRYATDAPLREGQSVTVTFPALPGRRATGRVSFVSPELAADSRVTLVRIRLPNPALDYTPGLQAVVRADPAAALVAAAGAPLLVPVAAVMQEEAGSTLWVRLPNGSFENRRVQLGLQQGTQVGIRSNLRAGEKVVVSGAYLLNSEYILQKGAAPMAGM